MQAIFPLKVQDAIVCNRCSIDFKNALNFYIISRTSLDFSVKFHLDLSFTRPNSCALSQSSPKCSIAI